MKRSEKIEIRVSLDEKEQLSRLAEQEGDSVSGLIRGLIRKYVSLNSPTRYRKLPKGQIIGLALIAAFFGYGLSLLPDIFWPNVSQQDVDKAEPQFFVHGAISESAFGRTLSENIRQTNFDLLSRPERTVTVSLKYTGTAGLDGRITVSACETTNSELCVPIYEGSTSIDRVYPSVIGAQTDAGESIHIFIQEIA